MVADAPADGGHVPVQALADTEEGFLDGGGSHL